MKDFLIKLISDEKGNISSARTINVLIGFCSVAMMWKMVWMGQVSSEIWGLWLAYGVGGAGWGKFVEHKSSTPTTPKAKPSEDLDPSLKQPKE